MHSDRDKLGDNFLSDMKDAINTARTKAVDPFVPRIIYDGVYARVENPIRRLISPVVDHVRYNRP
jgi:hypothetical protein